MNMMGLPLQGFGLSLHKGDPVKKPTANGNHSAGPAVVEPPTRPLAGATERRQLRHVSQLVIRGLDVEAAPEGYVLEMARPLPLRGQDQGGGDSPTTPASAEEAISEVVETSGIFTTRNPTWHPTCQVAAARHLKAFQVRARDVKEHHVFWRSEVRLSDLVYVCEDLEEQQVPPPFGVPLLRLASQWHTLPGRGWPPSGTSAPSSEPRRRNQARPPKEIKITDLCSAGDRMAVMLERLKSLQAQSSALRESMHDTLEAGKGRIGRQEQRLLERRRVQELREAVERRKESLQAKHERLRQTYERQNELVASVTEGKEQLRKLEEEQRSDSEGLASVNNSWRFLWMQLRCRQMQMMHEVSQVYPIDNMGRRRTIRGLDLAGIDTLCRQDLREEEGVSTALGFLAHLIVTLARLLEVPLRIQFHRPGSSRCSVRDPHETAAGPQNADGAAREWPLYYTRGMEKSRFPTALHLFRDCLHQFLYSRGYLHQKAMDEMGSNLLQCAEYILHKEMHSLEL
eukprot:TRINITY_DN3219_c0_g1_i1.p1 TRINITY_DN3219_c0_g1~~TRINITY_DN3219_c0_g1_i1.p1  ORF type:complete len:513 (-),score=126.41 TRINITY_DN3219_c0_g1_i1:208-1746(-)